MKTAFLSAGAGGMYCGNCLRDNTLSRALRALGCDATLVPLYTPLRLDEENAGIQRVFLGAVDVYLQQKFAWARRRRGLAARLLGSQAILHVLSRLALGTSPQELGQLTVSMLRGDQGHQRRSLEELCAWLGKELRPELVHVTNVLLVAVAAGVRRTLGIPVVCGLKGEDLFLDELPRPYRDEALALIREQTCLVDRFVAPSAYYGQRAADLFGLDAARIDVVQTGIQVEPAEGEETTGGASRPAEKRDVQGPLVVGYLARIAPEKGLHVLVEAFCELVASRHLPDVRLAVAGYLGGARNIAYARAIRRRVASLGLSRRVDIHGTLTGPQKRDFLRRIDVLSVPAVYQDPKGMFVLEALAAGVPVVLPRHGVFPELVSQTGGGLLHEPGASSDLARVLEDVLTDASRRAKLGSDGRRSVLAKFTERNMAEGMLETYRKAIGDAGPRPGNAEVA